jgi:hypothetical protein
MLKHHYSAFFISSHLRHFLTVSIAETPTTFHFPPLLKHRLPATPDAETPLFSIFHLLPPHHFSHLHHCRNNSVQQLFRLSLLLKHHLPATLHHSFTMLKHHRSAPFDFLQMPQHQLSAVLRLQYLFHLSLLLKHPPSTIVRQ